MTSRPYSPSPRPTFDGPAAIMRTDVTRHVWGDQEAGEVADLIYASTELVHCLVFALPVGGRFTHSPEFRTVFGADELLHVLSGTMVIADPETGEVQRVAAGQSVSFGPNTWHHAFAHGGEPLRVLEIFAPPPAAGASGAHSRTRPYLEASTYADDSVLGYVPPARAGRDAFRVVRDDEVVWRRDLGVLAGVLLSTEQLTVHSLEVNPGEAAAEHAHGGDEILFVTRGQLWVRAWHEGKTFVFELGPEDACFLPLGCAHEYRVYDGGTAEAIVGVAPQYLP
jgi:quercetin dioxygenase-like cupin family protein